MTAENFLWEPGQYGVFADFRDRPFYDLTARINVSTPRAVVDLGCGPGTLTATLGQRWPQAHILGIDNSEAMLAQARAHASPRVRFTHGDIAEWLPTAETEVVISNAALQWVPQHRELLQDWLRILGEGTWLAVQVPGNFAAPSHVLMRELAASPRWRERLDGVLRHEDAVGEPDEYHQLLQQAGADAEVWETTYQHLLQGPQAVLEWVRGTALRPILTALDPVSAQLFEQEYGTLLAQAYPPRDFGTLFSFRRIFMVGHKRHP